MPDLSSFPVTQRWPASHTDRLQLYAAPTPNGVKASIMLEETGLAYEPHLIDISNNESKDPAFVSLNPNGRIPAIIDPATIMVASIRVRDCLKEVGWSDMQLILDQDIYFYEKRAKANAEAEAEAKEEARCKGRKA